MCQHCSSKDQSRPSKQQRGCQSPLSARASSGVLRHCRAPCGGQWLLASSSKHSMQQHSVWFHICLPNQCYCLCYRPQPSSASRERGMIFRTL